jgi:hypothetical protein
VSESRQVRDIHNFCIPDSMEADEIQFLKLLISTRRVRDAIPGIEDKHRLQEIYEKPLSLMIFFRRDFSNKAAKARVIKT